MNRSARQGHPLTTALFTLIAACAGANSHFVVAQTFAGNASFSSLSDQNLLTYDFGTHLAGSDLSFNFSVFNLIAGAGSTSPLTLANVSSIGSSTAIELNHLPISGLTGGSSAPLSLVLDRSLIGEFAVNYLLEFSSDSLPSEPHQLVTVSGFGRVVLGGDFDGDYDVDGNDFLIWQRGVGLGPAATLEQGDADLDGHVDGGDLALWKSNFGNFAPPLGILASAPLPEPSSAALLLVAGGVCAATGRRRHVARCITLYRD